MYLAYTSSKGTLAFSQAQAEIFLFPMKLFLQHHFQERQWQWGNMQSICSNDTGSLSDLPENLYSVQKKK